MNIMYSKSIILRNSFCIPVLSGGNEMRHIKNTLLTFLVSFFMGISSAQAFSFDFGDDDEDLF